MHLNRRIGRCVLSGAVVLAGLLAALGCSGVPSAQESFARGPLPYHVCVFVDREALGFIAGDPVPGTEAASPAPPPAPREMKIQYGLDAQALARSVARALSTESGTVTLARVLEASNRADALKIARSAEADLLVAVGFETRPEYTHQAWSPGWGALEIGAWLFGGLPAWFVPSLKFSTLSRLKVEVVDLHPGGRGERSAPETVWKQSFDAPYQNLSLWDRSHPFDRPLDYVATIVVPPVVMNPGDPERVSRELTDDLTGELNDQFSSALHAQLIESESISPVSVGFLSPDPLNPVDAEAISLRLGIANRGPARVTALDLHRFVAGVEKFRWVMPRTEVEAFARRLSALEGEDGYVPLDLPDPIPIAAGDNILKIRVQRDDGLTVSRTMVYRK